MDEAYVSPRIKVEESPETPGKFVCAETRDVVVWNEEENYLFRLNEFKEPLKKWLTENEVRPLIGIEWSVRPPKSESTEVLELQDVLGPKRAAPPLQPKPIGQNGPYFGVSPPAGFN